ncbi:MAG: recombinase RecB, partial [Thermoprotei archaeon]
KRYRIKVEGVDIAEVDILAEKDGERYAVEVKAGRVSVTDLRQVYANAVLLKAKPLIVCRDFSDEAARKTAELLGVEVLFLPEFLVFVTPEELVYSVKSAVKEVLLELLTLPQVELSSEDVRVLKAIAEADSFRDAAVKLGMEISELGRRVAELRKKRVLVGEDYSSLRLRAILLLSIRKVFSGK